MNTEAEGVVFHAGFPNAGEDRLSSISLDQLIIKRPVSTFLWRLDATGVPELHWPAGSIVVVDRSLPAREGNLVVAVVEDDFVVRRFHKKVLYRPNGDPEVTEDVSIWGVVTYVVQDVRS